MTSFLRFEDVVQLHNMHVPDGTLIDQGKLDSANRATDPV